MIEAADIKAIATPKEVAISFLGMPEQQRGKNLWYCSPFRNEEHPSFKVDDIGMYDFGTNESYDIFRFVQKLRNCSFQESKDILATMYGVADRDYESSKMIEWYKQQRRKQEEHYKLLNWFYLQVWQEVDKEKKENQELLKVFKPENAEDLTQDETYKALIDQQVMVDSMEEHLSQDCDTLRDKETLMQKAMKGDLPTWLMNRLKATMTLLDLNTKLKQRREY